ncbi:MAG TPA: 4-amino-4-deoxy-L-arabinose transferase [Nocardioidaceae bacterium]|nr:4-amino-4-deoxy-L-arabinose transferase [Nocardioidaceae bacterium]
MSAADHWRRRVTDVADLVLWISRMRQPTLGGGRLVCVDGPAGSGKSTLGEAICDLAAETGTSALVHLDDLLDGWDGLSQVAETLHRDVLGPLTEGRSGRYRRYDWHFARFAEEHRVDPVDLLVVDGVGSGASAYSSLVTTLVWVDAPAELRLARGIARDGEALRREWVRWMRAEEALFGRERTRERADAIVDGTGEADHAVVLA